MATLRTVPMLVLTGVLVVSACSGGDVFEGPSSPSATTTTAPATTTTTPAVSSPSTTTITGVSTTTSPPTTAVADVEETTTSTSTTTVATTSTTTTTAPGGFDPALTARSYAVVLVAADDVLNIRAGPGVDYGTVTSLAPTAATVMLTGQFAEVGSATWVEVDSPAGEGWVNRKFLTEMWTSAEVDAEWDLTGPLDDLADEIGVAGDLSGPVSRRGLYVVYYDDEIHHWSPADLSTIMTDPTLYTWSGTGCYQCVEKTWADAIAHDLMGAYEDEFDDAVFALDDIILGGNGPFPPQAAIPVPLRNFHWLMIHDPGDDPTLGGLDWVTWFVYYDYENGEAKIVGLSPAAWAP